MKVSFVVLTYGFRDFVLECLSSLDAMEGRDDLEIIFVDNGSSLADREALTDGIRARNLKIDKYVALDRNDGISRGFNAGIQAATGDLVVALNSDTYVGGQVVAQLQRAAAALKISDQSQVGFLAVPLYDWHFKKDHAELSMDWQADVACLTCYVGGQNVRHQAVKERYVLGPSGPCIIMTRALVDDLIRCHGAVFDPHFYVSGEDIDLFLRARRRGYTTLFVPGDPKRGEVVWHIGSAFTSQTGMETLGKSPAAVKRILHGFWDNACAHAGLLELPWIVLMQLAFRLIFYVQYARKKSFIDLWRMWGARLPRRQRRLPGLRRPLSFSLLPSIALIYRRFWPWARQGRFAADGS